MKSGYLKGYVCRDWKHLRVGPAVLIVSVLLVLHPVPATGDEEPRVGLHTVTGFRTAVKDNLVKISWNNVQAEGNRLVYRSERPFDETSFSTAVLVGEVGSGITSFIDTPPGPGPYHYAVLLSTSGGVVKLFSPNSNTTTVPVMTSGQGERNPDLLIESISADVEDATVLLRFNPSRKDREVAVLRSTAPLASADDLRRAVILDFIPAAVRQYRDVPVPGIVFHYAVVDRQRLEASGSGNLKSGTGGVIPGVLVPEGNRRRVLPPVDPGVGRIAPLPSLVLSRDLLSGGLIRSDGAGAETVQPLRPEVLKAIELIAPPSRSPFTGEPAPELLEEDKRLTSSGEEKTLKWILDTEFLNGRWEQAGELIEKFLSLKRIDQVEDRSGFYLGQCRYFQGRYEEALIEFLLADGTTTDSARRWIDRTLRALITP